MKHTKMRFISILALLAGGVLLSVTVDRGTAHVIADTNQATVSKLPEFTIRRNPSSVTISGVTTSEAHEDRLLRDAGNIFPGTEIESRFRAGVILPGFWEDSSLRLLKAIGATVSATATIRGEQIRIRGITAESEAFASDLDSLTASVSPRIAINNDIVVIRNTASPEILCRRNLAQAASVPVEFRQSSEQIRSASLATLDRIVGVAYDCHDLLLSISGHSDASGDESWNQQLSLARAQTVAEYLIHAGIDPGRLQTFGLGSSVPVADNDTPDGRRKNRRIEFEFNSR